MVNAPPTPPPTTAAELHDQSQTQPQGSSTAPPPPAQLAQDSFPASFPLIVDLAAKAQYHDLIFKAEEIDVLSHTSRSPSRLFTLAPLVLTYLIMDNLPPAQYALSRLPDPLPSLPLTKALSELAKATADRQYNKIYSRAQALFNLASQPDFPDPKLASVVANLVTNFVEAFRQRTLVLLSRAYSSLPLSLAQVYLGISDDQVVKATEQYGWSYDTSTRILEPKAHAISTPQKSLDSISLTTFKFIADSVAELEA
ncbi:hypothetical protein AGABI1DRAFT_82333 [Agaricus bisporus var. burnettii JB137-S8]|uniref:CSN8/PSMD8/EIF3K domain-containing protein n=2 Tax=Agaricus bisporus var. burnettii TaxID=192524 RepID=K5W6Y5_AGABU|nr:uncharacterized protein AGABI1DRAFT_82333 [Agaricus bisporus var. burnettii JB137-S8]EKM82569.1 hypothetical protein AGABI1DRAFT_82333 [Agaricus bisporus var. burnettii JB137-S8]KAF7778622.1 hypothetical protein Agabi119p4_2967 [Agaricus bisporus var. burnettii]